MSTSFWTLYQQLISTQVFAWIFVLKLPCDSIFFYCNLQHQLSHFNKIGLANYVVHLFLLCILAVEEIYISKYLMEGFISVTSLVIYPRGKRKKVPSHSFIGVCIFGWKSDIYCTGISWCTWCSILSMKSFGQGLEGGSLSFWGFVSSFWET